MLPKQFTGTFGKFQVLGFLGEGGMGRTFKAKRGDRLVALKVPLRWLMDQPGGIDQFLDEGRAAQRLPIHPNLCVLYDCDITDEIPYLEMQFLPGGPIGWDPKRDVWDVVTLIHTLAKALHVAHQRRVIHRDLKPGNILRNENGDPVITDFGLALRYYDRYAPMPRQGMPCGTPGYMAPEQAGSWTIEQGGACDIFGLGVVFYQLLCGELPLSPIPLDEYYASLMSSTPLPPPSLHRPGLPPAVEEVCLHALQKTPADRYRSMDEFARALINTLGKGTLAPQPPALPPVHPRIPASSIRYLFVPTGTTAPKYIPPDRVYLDVGNDFRSGVLDHHQLEAAAGSSCRLVHTSPDLIRESTKPNRKEDDLFTFLLHEAPDLTCAASTFLARALLVDGDYPRGADLLTDYIDAIARGGPGFTSDNLFTLHAAYRLLRARLARNGFNSDQELWQAWIEQGRALITHVLREASLTGKSISEVDAFACADVMKKDDRLTMEGDRERYDGKLRDPRTRARTVQVCLPGKYSGVTSEPVAALLIDDVAGPVEERCHFFRDWARSDARRAAKTKGFVVLVVHTPERPGHRRRCQLMVRPDSGLCLTGLSERLDEAEAQARSRVFGRDDRVVDPILLERKPVRPGFSNCDPWYDGRSNHNTIVESPKQGTYLTPQEVETILLGYFANGASPVPLPAETAPDAPAPVAIARPRVAILRNLFDPPGSYDRNLVRALLERFDHVVVAPCVSRTATGAPFTELTVHRAALADLAFRGLPRVTVDLSDLAFEDSPGLDKVEERYRAQESGWKESEFRHVIQSTQFADLGELRDHARFLVVHPPGSAPSRIDSPRFADFMPLADRSRSPEELRQLVTDTTNSEFIPPQVLAYIRRHRLYTGAIPSRRCTLPIDRPRLRILCDRDNAAAVKLSEQFHELESGDPEMILVLGGDGYMLRSVWENWRERLPFYGINCGHLGFLMNKPQPLPFPGHLTLRRLPMLRVAVETAEGKTIVGRAFMDAWIERQGGQSAWLKVEINGKERLRQVVADGMLLATPAGSSAYARAMGAPTVPLDAPVLTMVGSNVFRPDSWKPVVLPDNSIISLTSNGDPAKRPLRAYLDGRPVDGLVQKMTIQLGNVSDVELAFLPEHDPEVKILQTLFPPTPEWKP